MSRAAVLLLLLMISTTALSAGAAARAQAAPATALGVNNPEFMGMVIRDPWYDFGTNPKYPGQPNYDFQDTMGLTLSNMGVRWVRLDFLIPLPYNSSADQINAEIVKYDYFINTVAPRYNLKILALLNFSLVQADSHELNCEKPECLVVGSVFGGGVNKYMDAWLTRALMIADLYRDKIAGYEVLNEENRLASDASAIAPSITGRLLTKFYRFCKNIDPIDQNHGCTEDTKIILGGIHPRGTLNAKAPNLTDAQYLQAIYADPNSFGSFNAAHGFFPVDGIGYHPYPQEIKLSPNDALVDRGLNRMRDVLNAVDPGQQFWVTEVGYNVGFDPDGPKNPIPAQTEAGQVAFMRDVYSSLSTRGDVANVFWFKYEDFPPDSGPRAQHWGVVQIPFTTGDCPGGACYDLSGKPAVYRGSYFAYRELAGAPMARTYVPLVGR